ncbi:MAG: 6-phosphofructokinase [Candidatus Heimdallarchaeota archaeon]
MELYETRLSILGHVQRGVAPSARSRMLAALFGVAAVDYFLEGKKKNFVGLENCKLVASDLDIIMKGPKQLDPQLLRIIEILSR